MNYDILGFCHFGNIMLVQLDLSKTNTWEPE